MNRIAKKTLTIIGIVLASIVGIFLIIYATFAIVRATAYSESNKLRRYVCTIPAIHSGYAPQGIGYSKEQDLYLLTGYDKSNISVLYLVKDDKATRVHLADKDGNVLKGHAGGITCTKDYVYISNGSKLSIYKLSELMSANGEKVNAVGVKYVDTNASYCFSDDNHIYVGEFYRAQNYKTDERHYYTTPNGDEHKAIVSCYNLDENGAITDIYPEYAISVTGLVQGFAVHDGTYMLSRSYGLRDSDLEYYSEPKRDGDAVVEISFKGDKSIAAKTIPLYYLDSSNMIKSLRLPAFSEDLTVVGDRVVITNESACNSYIVGKLFAADKVYSYPIFSA